jgi:GIY-YIG catalytic domain-containing protein
LIYAGQAGAGESAATLGSRIRGNHLGVSIYASTFRVTLASALLIPLALEPIGGRRMSADGEARLTAWMRAHLEVSILAYADRVALDLFETEVLGLLDPPLNLAKCPPSAARARLTVLRRAFTAPRRSARSPATRSVAEPRRVAAKAFPRVSGLTPEELAGELGLSNAKSVRAFLRGEFPRPEADLWSRWPPLTPEMERAVRERFGRRR